MVLPKVSTHLSTRHRVLKRATIPHNHKVGVVYTSFDSPQSTETSTQVEYLLYKDIYTSFDSPQSTETSPA
ncbi:MAG: hypothetical protein GFH25_541210n25 [Chloroflexi bacterium AL-N10]|nr:hypothetical protein [Chloroflexi bacterium AL-N1]NOK69598.1 hypothetical protein [Chloroflexi bacterium AL-N10]NOK72145.1 hypothetical protein [Chloroflexi bacterium AL-N5]